MNHVLKRFAHSVKVNCSQASGGKGGVESLISSKIIFDLHSPAGHPCDCGTSVRVHTHSHTAVS